MREQLLALARDQEEKIFIAKCIDLVSRVKQRHHYELTDMLHPGQLELLRTVAASVGEVRVLSWGGYQYAERHRAAVLPEWHREFSPEEFQLSVIRVSTRSSTQLGHRDYLGALLGLGIKREALGDIIVQNGGAYVVLLSDMAGFVTANLRQVGTASVQVGLVPHDVLESVPEPQLEAWAATVSSLRLDAVLAKAFNLSRDKAKSLVTQGKVKVNFRLQTSPSTAVAAETMISCRGYGRCKVLEVTGRSRKGRIRVVLGRSMQK